MLSGGRQAALHQGPHRPQGGRVREIEGLPELFGQLRSQPATMVFYEAPDRVAATLADLQDARAVEPLREAARRSATRTAYAQAAEVAKVKRFESGVVKDPITITPDMTDYHTFSEIAPTTIAAIIETGFLNLDREILTKHADQVATGIVDGILCFANNENVESTPIPGQAP